MAPKSRRNVQIWRFPSFPLCPRDLLEYLVQNINTVKSDARHKGNLALVRKHRVSCFLHCKFSVSPMFPVFPLFCRFVSPCFVCFPLFGVLSYFYLFLFFEAPPYSPTSSKTHDPNTALSTSCKQVTDCKCPVLVLGC